MIRNSVLCASAFVALLSVAETADAAKKLTVNRNIANCNLEVCTTGKFTDTYTNPSIVPINERYYVKRLPGKLWNFCPFKASYLLPQFSGEGYTAWSKTVTTSTNPGPKLHKWKNYLTPKQYSYRPIY